LSQAGLDALGEAVAEFWGDGEGDRSGLAKLLAQVVAEG
jgi:hypothetical protein